jgi:uncharacterized protein (DUF433 family)
MTEAEEVIQFIREAADRGDLTIEDLEEIIDYARRLLEANNREGGGNDGRA